MQLFDVPDCLKQFDAVPCLSTDMPAFKVRSGVLPAAVKNVASQGGYELLVDVTAIDHGLEAECRFCVVYHFYHLKNRAYLRLVADCTDNQAPKMPTISPIYPAANWHERETYDMFGIVFENHPDLRRILMWEGYPYYPLRKDFPLAGIDAPWPSAETASVVSATVTAAPMMGGPFQASPGGSMASREPEGADQSWTEDKLKNRPSISPF